MIVIKVGLSNVLSQNDANIGKQVEEGIHMLRAVEEQVQIVVCNLPEMRGQTAQTERMVVGKVGKPGNNYVLRWWT